jgi:sec-independent protein translocase protein TatA
MFGIGTFELVILGIVAVLLFGSRLPSVARSLGKSLNEFKRGMREFEDEVNSTVDSEPKARVTYNDQNKSPEWAESKSAEMPEPAESRTE